MSWKDLAIAVVVSLFGNNFFAQETTASFNLSKKDPIPEFFEYVNPDGGVVTLGNLTKRTSRYVGLNKYSGNLKREWTKQVLEQNSRKRLEYLATLEENILVMVSEYMTRESKMVSYFYHYDLDGNRVKEKEPLMEVAYIKDQNSPLQHVYSRNKKALLTYKTSNVNDIPQVLYATLDENANVVANGTMNFPLSDEKMEVRKVELANNGNIYVLCKYRKPGKVKRPDDSVFRLFKFQGGGAQPHEILFTFGDSYITDLSFKLSRDETLYLAGFYSNSSTYEIIGTVYQQINQSDSVLISTEQKFSDDFLSVFLSDKQIERGHELRYFYLDEIYVRSDGGVLILAEKYYVSYNTYLDNFGYWLEQKVHNYEDIIVNSVSSEGQLEWSQVIPKHQASEINTNLSYRPVIAGSNMYFIYEDNPRRMPRSVYYNVITVEGNQQDRRVFPGSGDRMMSFFPSSSSQITNNEALLVFYSIREKLFSIRKVAFY